ncbi:hypothetical protein [Photorhabdus cinerea]|uniref:Uncharacterized protein n=1 Tax=Photorhabdus cinerea TaxID=471575 RepID=A0A7X5TIF9_9GAMM|nr:hypothetical protein [Photorhabdus cinerea]NHB93860.1 hypothetical protein [Photorhabdus cinerea]
MLGLRKFYSAPAEPKKSVGFKKPFFMSGVSDYQPGNQIGGLIKKWIKTMNYTFIILLKIIKKRIIFSGLISNVNDFDVILFFVLFCDLYHIFNVITGISYFKDNYLSYADINYHILLSNSVDYFEQSEPG